MLLIKCKKNSNVILTVEFKGHAKYNNLGKDIVCAAASSIYITTVNSILSFDKNSIEASESKIVNIKKDDITNKLLTNMMNMLKELEEQYKKNIKIMEE